MSRNKINKNDIDAYYEKTLQDIEKRLRSIIVEKLEIEEYKVTNDAHFMKDLGADSLDFYELVYNCEDEFNISLSDELASTVETVSDAVDLILKLSPVDYFEKIESRAIHFRLGSDNKFKATLQYEDGSWCYADGKIVLPSRICLLTYSRYANILKELEEIINDVNVRESDLQEYFEKYPELLKGDDYDVIIPQAVIEIENTKWKSDFILIPINQYDFAKVLELKIPQFNLFNKPHSGHFTFSANLLNAFQQTRDYGQAFDNKETREKFRERYKVDVLRPELHLIAGRKWDISIMDPMRRHLSETHVKFENWDSAYERLKRRFTVG